MNIKLKILRKSIEIKIKANYEIVVKNIQDNKKIPWGFHETEGKTFCKLRFLFQKYTESESERERKSLKTNKTKKKNRNK